MMNSEMAAKNSGTGTVTVSKGKHQNATRLQKQAPANLQIDEISGDFSKKTVIPFLSPLVLSPDPNSPEVVVVGDDAKRSFAVAPNTDNNHAIGIVPETGGGGGGDSGWKHPAMAAGPVADASSSLYAYFHSQCTILPRNR